METLKGRVAVVTGAASGIGLALVRRFAEEGMKVVLADVEETALESARRALEDTGAEVLAVRTDVRFQDDVQALAERAVDAFGGVHLLCNNAGVITGGISWEAPIEDYEWTLGVNVMGVVHGVRAFVPILLEQEEGHIVNTASMAAVTTLPFTSIYNMSKHAVLAYSESLYHELVLRGTKVGVSALCPELIATRIDRSDRNRPPDLKAPDDAASSESELVMNALADGVTKGIPPSEIAGRVVDAVLAKRFYILSEDEWRRACETRQEDIRLGRNPTFAPPQLP